MTLEFLITCFIIVLAPGTGVVFTVSTGLARGRAMSVAAAVGCTLGIVPAILATVLGVAAVLHTSALAFAVVKYAGVAYLFYLAWQTLRSSGSMRFETGTPGAASAMEVVWSGFVLNILNPKLTVFFFAFLPQFIDPATGSATGQMLAMSAVFMGMTFAVFLVYGALAAQARQFALGSETFMRWMRRTVALAFAGFGLRLALSDR